MSVKKRLFISNILMLVMPVVMTLLMSACLLLIYFGVTGVRDFHSLKHGDRFYNRIDIAETMVRGWSSGADDEEIRAGLERFNVQYENRGLFLYAYRDGKLLYPAPAGEENEPYIGLSPPAKGNSVIVTDDIAVYRAEAGSYTALMTDTGLTLGDKSGFERKAYIGFILFIFLIAVILFTSQALTRFVFRSIVTPLDALADGVHQLRDGNLGYRIQYSRKDEFAVVCDDFNEMARHLSAMVDARQKDEINRRELIAGISHDLRTPLTSIKAYLEGIEKGVASSPHMQRKYFDIIKSKTSSLEQIINQLFLFSKLDIGEFPFRLERVDLRAELDEATALFAADYGTRGLQLTLENRLPDAFVKIDVVQFRNVLQNIVENSLKYNGGNGALLHMTGTQTEDAVQIALTDQGPGVPADELEKLFDVFYRSDVSRKKTDMGSGLGLAISRKIIEGLGGRIAATNGDERGLSIIISLPRDKGETDDEKNIDR